MGNFPQERLTPKGQLFVVADDFGDFGEGKQARKLTVDIIQQAYYSDPNQDVAQCLKRSFEDANRLVHELFNDGGERERLSISCTALVLTRDRVYLANTGDNRAYRLTRDTHNGHNGSYRAGDRKSPAENFPRDTTASRSERSGLCGALGVAPSLEVQIEQDVPLQPGDCYLLCNDPLTRLDEQEIKQIVLSNSPPKACQKLLRLATRSGCKEKINAQVIQVKSVPRRPRLNVTLPTVRRIRWVYPAFTMLLAFMAVLFSFQQQNEDQQVAASEVLFRQNEWLWQTPANAWEQEVVEAESVNELLSQAAALFHAGALDGALSTYRAALRASPMNPTAGLGIRQVLDVYKARADSLFDHNSYQAALKLYQEAARWQPNDESLKHRIAVCEQKLQTVASLSVSTTEEKTSEAALEESSNDQTTAEKSPGSNDVGSSEETRAQGWQLLQLSPADCEMQEGKIVFLESPKRKKALYHAGFTTARVQVRLQVANNNTRGRCGLILGYESLAASPYESFYLFSVYNQNRFLLQKFSNFKKQLIFSVAASEDSLTPGQDFLLKARWYGTNLEIYLNEKLLFQWQDQENISGQAGLYADPNLRVEFSKFEIARISDSVEKGQTPVSSTTTASP